MISVGHTSTHTALLCSPAQIRACTRDMEESLEQKRMKLRGTHAPFTNHQLISALLCSPAQIRAYARDMEESLEQERMKLEEVVKMEIKARMTAGESLREQLAAALGQVRWVAG